MKKSKIITLICAIVAYIISVVGMFKGEDVTTLWIALWGLIILYEVRN